MISNCVMKPYFAFKGNKQQTVSDTKTKPSEQVDTNRSASILTNYAIALLMLASPTNASSVEKNTGYQNDLIELMPVENSKSVEPTNVYTKQFKSQLSEAELADAPSPNMNIAGKNTNVGIVVDVPNNKLYRYDNDGNVIDGYKIATGVIRNGKSITHGGLRKVTHIETYPYKSAPASAKRRKHPNDYGPNILVLTSIDKASGKDMGSNGEFIHGTNHPESIGHPRSHGCMRMENEVIKKLAGEVKPGTYVWIIN